MKSSIREKAVYLRLEKELSYSEIRKKLKVPKSTLSYWLRDFPLSKERILELRRSGWSKGEAAREKYRETMRQKKERDDREEYLKQKKVLARISSDAYFVAGLMLYLAEGAKKKDSQIVLTNTDPNIIKFFAKWLEKYLYIESGDMRVQLHLYENMDIKKEQKFWANQLKLTKNQFYKHYVSKLKRGSFTYRSSFNHGTCSLYVFGVKIRRKLMMAIKAFVDLYLEE